MVFHNVSGLQVNTNSKTQLNINKSTLVMVPNNTWTHQYKFNAQYFLPSTSPVLRILVYF